jgi:predicted SAM-dependent methyltransferase
MKKLHLGCGDIRLDGWLNIDARPGPAVDAVCDLTDLAPVCGPSEADAVYACHVLEHFGFGIVRPSAFDVLRHWVTRLRHGGECFISVPDLQRIGAAIARTDSPHEQYDFMRCLYGGCEYPQNRHFIGFTVPLLRSLMRDSGLVDIQTFDSFAADTSRFNLHGCDVSLNLKGTLA